MIDKVEIVANNWANNDVDTIFITKLLKDIYKAGFKRGVERCREMKGFTPEEVEYILIEVGQRDRQFKVGQLIKYSPSSVKEILKEYELDED